MTGTGEIGTFGSFSVGAGLIGEMSAGFGVSIFWPEADQSALARFKGYNGFVALDAGEGVTVGATIYWPESALFQFLSATPCGIAISAGMGVGLPINIMAGQSVTDILSGVTPPPEPQPRMHGL